MSTSTWGGGSGAWFVAANWLNDAPPVPVAFPGAEELVYIRDGAARITGASLDNIRLELETAAPSSGVVPHLQLVDATLGVHVVIETRDKYKPANKPTGGQASQIDIGGTVEFGGLIGFAQNFGFVDIADLGGPATFHLLAGGSVSNTVGADMQISTTNLVNDGIVSVRTNILTIDSANVSGAGTFAIDNNAVMRFSHGADGGTVNFKITATTAELELDDVASFSASITGMHASNAIHLVQTNADAASYADGVLTISFQGATVATLPLSGNFAADSFTVTQLPNFGLVNDVMIVACFAEGTHIATAAGPMAVEALRAGDFVATPLQGGFARVAWIGHRRLDLRRHPRPQDVQPVRIKAHAFAPGQPARDLLLSPDHAIFDPALAALVPIRCLLNGATIVQEHVAAVQYFHLELERHAVLLAEGLPAESYLDTGNRAAFANGGDVAIAHPDFASPLSAAAIWAANACAPQQRDTAALAPLAARLQVRAEALGYIRVADPALELFADGVAVRALRLGPHLHVRLPVGTRRIVLRSRIAVPAHVIPGATDTRPLGVAVAALRLDGRHALHAEDVIGTGWHAPEPTWRWTDDAAEIAVHGARVLELDIVPGVLRYWSSPGDDQAVARAAAR